MRKPRKKKEQPAALEGGDAEVKGDDEKVGDKGIDGLERAERSEGSDSDSKSSIMLTVSNTGGGTLHWAIAAPSEVWITLSQREGNTTSESAKIDVRIDREQAPAGLQQVKIVVTGDGEARQEVTLLANITKPKI